MPAVSVRSDAALVFGWEQRLTLLPAEPIRVPRENTIRFLLPDARVLLRLCALLSALIALALLTACSPRHLVVQAIAGELPTQGQVQEVDLQLAREAAAFYLKLSESMLGEMPDHVRLSEAAAGGSPRKAKLLSPSRPTSWRFAMSMPCRGRASAQAVCTGARTATRWLRRSA